MARPDRRSVANAVAERLSGITTATGYYGQVGRRLDGTLGDDPVPKSATDQRVEPYFVLYPGTGGQGPDADLGDCNEDLTQPFQVTAVAGDVEELLALVDAIDGLLFRWEPAIAGLICGPMKPPEGYTAGPHLIDRQYAPPRLYTPLLYQLTATT